MRIVRLLLNRLLQLAALALLISLATFLLSALIPGDFYSAQELDPSVRQQTLDRLRQQHGLDRSFLAQYGRWLQRSVRLDFGDSEFFRRPVRSIMLDALAKTLWLGIPALLAGLAGGILLGAFHARFRDRPPGMALDLLSTLALALPTLVLGLAALLLAASTQWFPLGGMNSPDLQAATFLGWLWDRLEHLLLPAACLTIPILAYVERIQCAATGELLEAPHVRAARARGLSRPRIFFDYLLRPSLNPVLAASGPLLGAVLSGSLVVEVIFAWPGLGQVTYDALFNRDQPLIAGCVVGSAFLLVAGNLAADLLMLILDPRTRGRAGEAA